ncbi:MAG: DUF1028 domain-containing protein [Spirochaetaceae bacterium]|nr:DUF1028 domain-containing protein [Spirochaetaceae bacterium]
MIRSDIFSTYSIVATDADEIGAAVQTHQMAVGSIVPWLLPGLGAVVTQSLVNVSLGPLGLRLLEQGVSPNHIIAALEASDREAHRRQFAVINAEGIAAAYTGAGCIQEAGHRSGSGYSVQANMMLNDSVVDAMANAFEADHGPLPERMLAALEAAQEQAGDIRGMQSAALVTVANDPQKKAWEHRFDLRVDEHEQPLSELRRLVRLRRAQLVDAEGQKALEAGDVDAALKHWAEARAIAPEQEELAFWQAVQLADTQPDHGEDASALLKEALTGEPYPERWMELVDRLVACGIMKTADLRSKLEIFM